MKFARLSLILLHMRTQAHVFHWQVRLFSAHKALEKLYEGLTDLADTFTETCQGTMGLIEVPENYSTAPLINLIDETEPLTWLLSAREAWVAGRDTFDPQADSHILNIMDEVTQLIDTTIYKLRNLS